MNLPESAVLQAVGQTAMDASRAFRIVVPDNLDEEELPEAVKQLIGLLGLEDEQVVAAAAAALGSRGAYSFIDLWQYGTMVAETICALTGAISATENADVLHVLSHAVYDIYKMMEAGVNLDSEEGKALLEQFMPKVAEANIQTKDSTVQFDLERICGEWNNAD